MEEKNKNSSNKEISADELLKMLKINIESPTKRSAIENDVKKKEVQTATEYVPEIVSSSNTKNTVENKPSTKAETDSGRVVYHFKKTYRNSEVIRTKEGRKLDKELKAAEEEEDIEQLLKKYLPENVEKLIESDELPELSREADGGEIRSEEAKQANADSRYAENSSSDEVFHENSILKGINIIKDNPVLTDIRTDASGVSSNEEYSEYRRRAEQSKIDIKKRIIDAEAYVSDISSGKKISDKEKGSRWDTDASAKDENVFEKTDEVPTDETELPDFDETDAKLLYAFGSMEELEKTLGKEKAAEINDNIQRENDSFADGTKNVRDKRFGVEYISPDQNKEIYKKYRDCYRSLLVKLFAALVMVVVTFFFENISLFGGSLPVSMNTNVYPVVYTMVSLQMLVLCGAIAWRQLLRGAKAIPDMKLIPETALAAVMAFSLLYHIACLAAGERGDIHAFNFPVSVCVFLMLLHDFMNLRREIFSFNIVSSKRTKFAMNKLGDADSELERAAFANYLSDTNGIYRINKANFIDNFFARCAEYPKNKSLLNVLIPAASVIALIFAATGWIVSSDMYTGAAIGYMTVLLGMPASIFVTYSYPFYKASREAHSLESAIIGETALEECANASVVAFEDKEVFPSYCVKVKSVKVYGDNRIDQIIYTLAGVFHKVGGSLSEVLDLATLELGHSEEVKITEVDEDGLEAVADGRHIYIGKSVYLRKKGYIPVYDQSDDNLEDESDISIMFLVMDNEVAAKVYVEYVIDPDFEFLMKQLYRTGICIGIRSFDPNINNEMLSRKVKLSKYPVKVIKCSSDEEITKTEEKLDSGIVSRSSVKNLLSTLTLCDKVIHVIKTSSVLMMFTLIVGMVVSGFILALGYTGSVLSFFIVLYHMFWIVPMIVITKLMI